LKYTRTCFYFFTQHKKSTILTLNLKKPTKQMKQTYTVSVGNVGNMDYTNKKLAEDCYKTYVTLSVNYQGRAAGESVTLFKNDEILKEYSGTMGDDESCPM
jgi:protein involved in sex pheromone biosynthesis